MYIIVSWWRDGSSAPTVAFSRNTDGAIALSNDASQDGKEVTVYEITESGLKLVFGRQLQKVHDEVIV